MKKQLFILLISLCSITAFGQSQHLIGISGGINVARMSGYASEGFLVAPVTGVQYQLKFARILSFEAGVLYDQRGGMAAITLTNELAQEIRKIMVPQRHKYLSVPLKFGMVSRGDISVFGNLGIMPSYLIKAIIDYPESSVSEEVKVDYTDGLHRIDVAVLLEGGVGVKLTDRLQVTATAGAQLGLLDVVEEEVYVGSVQPYEHHYGFSFSIGLKYAFGGDTFE